MEEKIKDYLHVIYAIALSKGGDMFAPTIPGMNIQRMDKHDALFNEIASSLSLAEGFTSDDAYWRSKDLFANLDKIFRLYNDFDLDLTNREHVTLLEKDLYRFISSTEVKNFLDGRT